ncbi:RAB3-GAP REGULATORY DOMAIN [Salix koriyanagi]|uniref:RAB3-GAP REGULATORY DOMAIN n=1 Tax=Salix koriyanagi TaxID=2511006 RepID=A0A9Q0WZQ3_9ROSI|nr:RAB3-GAP REGULATORY DOMAIN [Salix koriyanagi]
MSSNKRSHTTELGCIASEELTDLGAGKEGWLVENPNLVCALDTHSLALANRSFILITGWDDGPRIKIRPELSPIELEIISALEWLVFDEIKVIAVGTSRGYFMVYSLDGLLIHRQLVYPGRILKLRVRGTKKDMMSSHDGSNEEVSAVIPGVIARFDGADIRNILQEWFQERNSHFWDERSKRRDYEELGKWF